MKRKVIILLLFLILGILFRFPSFHRSVIDHDESTYILIADAMIEGEQLYVDRVDIKPPGIFVLFYLFLKIFRDGILTIRIVASLFVSLTAYFIYTISNRLWKDELIAFLSGLLYIFLTSISYFALAANTEIFFLFFITSGIFIIYQQEEKTPPYFVFGLLVGTGILIKQIVLFEALFFGLVALGYHIKLRKTFTITIERALLYSAGIILPAGVLFLIFTVNGHLKELIEYIYYIPGRYPSTFTLGDVSEFILRFHLHYCFAIIPSYISLAYYITRETGWIRTQLLLILLWFCIIWVSIIVPGKFFQHYYMQLFPVVCISAPGFLLLFRKSFSGFSKKNYLVLGILISVLFSVTLSIQKFNFSNMDIPRQIEADIGSLLNEDDEIFIGRQFHILYYLLDRKPLTKYVHPSLLSNKEHIQALGYDNNLELKNILDQKPKFIITKGPYPIRWVEDYITGHYNLYKWYDNKARVMKLDNNG